MVRLPPNNNIILPVVFNSSLISLISRLNRIEENLDIVNLKDQRVKRFLRLSKTIVELISLERWSLMEVEW